MRGVRCSSGPSEGGPRLPLGGSDDVMLKEECQGSVSGVSRQAQKRLCAELNGDDVTGNRSNPSGKVTPIRSETLVILGEWKMGVEVPGGKGNTGGLSSIVTQLSSVFSGDCFKDSQMYRDAHIPPIELHSVSLAFCTL